MQTWALAGVLGVTGASAAIVFRSCSAAPRNAAGWKAVAGFYLPLGAGRYNH